MSQSSPLETWEVLDLLQSLVDKSLVVHEEGADGQGRYRLLETVREYAAEKQTAAEDGALLSLRHRDFFLAFAEEAKTKLRGQGQAEWLTRLEMEHDNLRNALARCRELPDAWEMQARLTSALSRFWIVRGYLREGRKHLEDALNHLDARQNVKLQADILASVASLAYEQGDHARAQALCEQSLAICREQNDQEGIAGALNRMGLIAWHRGDMPLARAHLNESLAIRRTLNDWHALAASLLCLGLIAQQEAESAQARALYEESLLIFREQQDLLHTAAALNNLGTLAREEKNHEEARQLFGESLSCYEALAHKGGIALILLNLGHLAHVEGDYASCRAFLQQSFDKFQEIGDRNGIAAVLEIQGDTALSEQMWESAARLFLALAAFWETMGKTNFLQEREKQESALHRCRFNLSEEAYEVVLETMRDLTPEQAAACAMNAEEMNEGDAT